MTCEDRVKNGFGIYEIDENTGHIKAFNEVKTIYDGNKLTGISTRTLRNAADKGNPMITRRKDKKRFILSWQTIHEWCFQKRKGERWLETRRKVREGIEI